MSMKKVAAPFAALALGASLTAGAATTADAHGSDDGARKITECKGKKLKVRIGKTGAAAGSTYRTIKFRNRGKRCIVRTWPAVMFRHKSGVPVGFFAKHRHKRPRLVLRHGQSGKVTLQTPNPGNFPRRKCQPYRVNRLVTYLPGRVGGSVDNMHAKKLKRSTKVCSTQKGRSRVYRMRKVR